MPSTPAPSAEYDVFVCCPDPSRAEACETLVAYLSRAGFHVFYQPGGGVLSAPDRVTLARSASDFILVTPSAGFDPATAGGHWQAELGAALASGRNVVRVSMAGEQGAAAPVPLTSSSGLAVQELSYDRDRLAESLSLIQHSLSTDTIVNDRHMMRRTRRWFVFAGALLLAGFSLQAIPQVIEWWNRPRPLPPVAPYVLHWSGFAERAGTGGVEEFPLSTGTVVKPGDRLRVSFAGSADGFAYVVVKDTRGRVVVLFPTEKFKGASRVRAGSSYSAPAGPGWLAIDAEVGIDTIYIFASYDPLQNIEELVEEPETGNDTGARRALVDQTVNGLLDGKHVPAGPRVWIRSTAAIDQSLQPAPGPQSFSATLSTGTTVSRPAAVQRGLVNALAEIKLTFAR